MKLRATQKTGSQVVTYSMAHYTAKPPTTQQLATIAAQLARLPNDNPAQLVEAALALWEAADKQVEFRNLQDSCLPDQAARDAYIATLPKPKTFPVERDDFLKLLMPTIPAADRARRFRQYLAAWKHDEAEDQIVTRYAQWEPLSESDYPHAVEHFRVWQGRNIKAVRSQAARSRTAPKKKGS